jgi:DNA polymerase-3 subunit gamma/tau
VNHAYLFSGPRGCGKTSSARILARSLNCEQGPTPDPCGVCASCVALAPAGPGSIDVIEIDAASHGGVDDARDLRERAFFAPVSGRFKIYIIDEAHMVTREGFNALLKLVEEPPPHLKFVFATTEPEKVIATIRSRTHHYPFRLVPPAVLRELLEQILGAEGIKYEPTVLPVVIRAGAGSVRDSLSVLDQLIAGSDEAGLVYAKAVALLGYTDDRLLDEVVQAFAAGDGAAVFRAIDRVVEAGHDPRRFAADLLDRMRDLIVLAAVPDAVSTGLLDVPADRLDGMRAQADGFGQAELTRAAEIISAGLVEMRGATSPRLLLELMCAQVLLPGGGAGDTDLLSRLERLERRLESAGTAEPAARPSAADPAPPASPPERQAAPASRPAAAPARPQDPPPSRAAAPADSSVSSPERPAAPAAVPAGGSSGPVDAAMVQDRWPDILEAVKGERRVAWILLTSASVGSLADGVLTIEFNTEGNARGFATGGHEQLLADVLRRMFGVSFQVKGTGRPSGGGAAAGRGPAGGNGGRNPGSRGDSGWGDAPGGAGRAAPPEPGAGDGGRANGNGTSASHGAAGKASGGRGSGSSGSGGMSAGGSGIGGPGAGGANAGGAGVGGRGAGGPGSGGSGLGGSGSAGPERSGTGGGANGSGGRGSGGRGPAGQASGTVASASGGANGGSSAGQAPGGTALDEVPIPDWDDSGDWEDPRDQDDMPMGGPGGFSGGNGVPGQRGPAAPPGPPSGLELIEKELGGRIIENPDG